MRFAAHQTFSLRTSWLSNGLTYIKSDKSAFQSIDKAAVDLGIGKNMAHSALYWLSACKLITKEEKNYQLTDLAKKIMKYDPFFELDGTLIILHHMLACNSKQATTWNWYFNHFNASEFDSDSLLIYLRNYVSKYSLKQISAQSLNKDILCLIRMYAHQSYNKKETPETTSLSPFSRFSLINKNNNLFHRQGFKLNQIDCLIYLYLLSMGKYQIKETTLSISFETLTKKTGYPGVTLGFNDEENLEMIDMIEQKYNKKYLTYSKSGGFFSIQLNKCKPIYFLDQYYKKN